MSDMMLMEVYELGLKSNPLCNLKQKNHAKKIHQTRHPFFFFVIRFMLPLKYFINAKTCFQIKAMLQQFNCMIYMLLKHSVFMVEDVST